MKKINNTAILVIGILLFIVSYSLDQSVSLFFKNTKFAFLDVILSIITNFGFVVAVILIIPSCILYKKNKNSAYLLWLAFIASSALDFIIKLVVQRPRPIDTIAYPFIRVINYSFPSMHAIVAFSALPAIAKYLPKQRHFFVIFAFLVAISRVYFNLHFLSDVVFGALAGWFIGSSLLWLYEKGKLWK